MAKYIDREEYCEKHCRCSNEYCDKERCPIWKAPTVDAEVVVHCKGCKHLQCCKFTQFLGADGYCSYGEYKCNTEDIKWQTKR